MKITQLDRETVTTLRQDIDNALASIGKKYGIQINTGNARFTRSNVTFKVNAAVKKGEIALSREALNFDRCSHLGLNPLKEQKFKLGGKIILNTDEYTITGWSTRSKKYPVLCERDGKTYKVSCYMIKLHNTKSF